MGNHHRDDGDDPEKEFEGDIGPSVHIGQKERQYRGQDGRADGKNKRVGDDLGKLRVSIGRDILVDREAVEGAEPLGKASHHEHYHGTDRQKAHNHDQDRGKGWLFHHADACAGSRKQWSGSKEI